MRIKIIGENNCARATRHLLRLAGFAVTEFLPADAVAGGPLAGYAITIDLAPAHHTSDAHLRPDPPTHQLDASASEEAPRSHRDASSPAFVRQNAWRTTAGLPAGDESEAGSANFGEAAAGGIHFDSVECALEAAVLRHVTQLAAAPVIVDRPGGVVHSDRELRIVAPNTGDAKADEAAAVAIEFGVLRGLLDLEVLSDQLIGWCCIDRLSWHAPTSIQYPPARAQVHHPNFAPLPQNQQQPQLVQTSMSPKSNSAFSLITTNIPNDTDCLISYIMFPPKSD